MPDVETELGRELCDICKICKYVGMPDTHLQAALLGRIGVCATAWGNPYLLSHSSKSSGADIGDES